MAAREQVWVRAATDLSPKLYKKLKAKAESEHRSVSAQIRMILERELEKDDADSRD